MRLPLLISGFFVASLTLSNPVMAQEEAALADAELAADPAVDAAAAVATPEPEGTSDEDSDAQGRDAQGSPEVAPTGAVPVDGASLQTADESYDVKIRDMEEKVNELKEKIFRSKARLLALQEMVFTGVSTGARAVIVHRNEMGASFRLREMHYFIDGAPLKQEVDETGDGLNAKEEIQLFSGNIVPGNHQITVNLTYQGHGFGVFSYLNGYTFRIKSSYTFKAEDGKETRINIVAHEKGGFTTELKDRPAVRYDVEVQKNKRRAKADDAAAKPAGTEP